MRFATWSKVRPDRPIGSRISSATVMRNRSRFVRVVAMRATDSAMLRGSPSLGGGLRCGAPVLAR